MTIYTNATILTNDRIIELIKNRKVRLEITNHGEMTKIFHIDRENIRNDIVELTEWHNLGEII